MARMPRIGVLGGMGPAATILLQQRLLEAVEVTSDAGHIPLLIDMNPQVPSRIDYLIHGRGEDPGPVLAGMAQGLEAAGVDAVVMPCCTAHHFADQIVGAIRVPFLNMVELAAQELAGHLDGDRGVGALPPTSPGIFMKKKKGLVGVLASPATDRIGLFQRALERHGMTAVYPEDQGAMLAAIEGIKARGPSDEDVAVVQGAMRELAEAGAGAFLVGCSEFSLISRRLRAEVPVVDALDALTAAIRGLLPGTD
ncbi:MAG: aspartate/glutamate racemase family protein [Pseudomonadota bacterium]